MRTVCLLASAALLLAGCASPGARLTVEVVNEGSATATAWLNLSTGASEQFSLPAGQSVSRSPAVASQAPFQVQVTAKAPGGAQASGGQHVDLAGCSGRIMLRFTFTVSDRGAGTDNSEQRCA